MQLQPITRRLINVARHLPSSVLLKIKQLFQPKDQTQRNVSVPLRLLFLTLSFEFLGGGRRDRTDDPLLAKQVLSQLSYAPISMHIPHHLASYTYDQVAIPRIL